MVSIGCDIGGSFIKMGGVSQKGEILIQRTLPSKGINSPSGMAEWIAKILMSFYKEVNEQGISPVGAGIGIPGPVHFPDGTLFDPPNLPLKGKIPMGKLIRERLPFPVILDNDATLQTLGESWLGEGAGIDHFVFLSLGTGIGGGIVINGEIYRGNGGFAGEIGHLTIDFNGRPCHCGSRGCLETYASLNGLANTLLTWQQPLPSDLTDILREKRYGNLPELLVKKITGGERQWQQAWDIFADALGAGIGFLINLFNPQKVILSGGLSHYSDFFLPRTLDKIPLYCFPVAWEECQVCISTLKNKAGILGAAYLAFLNT